MLVIETSPILFDVEFTMDIVREIQQIHHQTTGFRGTMQSWIETRITNLLEITLGKQTSLEK